MTQEHPITPPPELMQQWAAKYWGRPNRFLTDGEKCFATQAARWGADMELEACCEYVREQWFEHPEERIAELRAARRPKPPSLKEQALDRCNDYIDPDGIIRRALEALPDD